MNSSLWWLMQLPQEVIWHWAHIKVPSSTNHQCSISTFKDQTLLSWPFYVISLDRNTLVFSKGWTNPGHSDFPCLCSQMPPSLLPFTRLPPVCQCGPGKHTALQMCSHQCWRDGMDQFSQSADYILAIAAWDVTSPLYCKVQCQFMVNLLPTMNLQLFSANLSVTLSPACPAVQLFCPGPKTLHLLFLKLH